jgi:hypothetical protein
MADLLVAKIMFNSVVSTKDARFMTLVIGNFYLNTPLKRYEYVQLKLTDIPEEIIVQYNLRAMATPDGYVYIQQVNGTLSYLACAVDATILPALSSLAA